MIISVISQKGGAGKTTISLNLAACFAHRGLKVLFIDADPQATASDWALIRSTLPIFRMMSIQKPILHRSMPKLSKGYDHVIIDGAPRDYDMARSVIAAADRILIPVQPSGADFWAARETVKLALESQGLKPDQRAAFVVSRRIGRSAIGGHVSTALASFKLPVLDATLSQRIAYAEAMTKGSTVVEAQPNGVAAEEVNRLAAEVLAL